MMLRALRAARHKNRLEEHLKRVDQSLGLREEYDRSGKIGMVLAVNYELVSDATRALHALRCLEELEPAHTVTEPILNRRNEIRRELTRLVDLPAVPLWRLRASPHEGGIGKTELNKLYSAHVGLNSNIPEVEGWKGLEAVERAKRTVAYACHGSEERWEEIQFDSSEAIVEFVVTLFEAGSPSAMRDQDAFVLVDALTKRFDATRDDRYWIAELDHHSAMELLIHIWATHTAHGVTEVNLTFWYRQMRLIYTATVRGAKRGESFDESRLTQVAVDGLTAGGIEVTPLRVHLYSHIVRNLAGRAKRDVGS